MSFIRFLLGAGAEPLVEMPTMDDFKHEYDLDSLILVSPRDRDFSMYVTPRYRHHYEGQSYECFSANLLAGVLNRAKLFVDVGAHYGFFTLLAATRHPQLEILAFEPVPKIAEVLRQNISLHNLQNATIRQMAVSSTEGFSTMWISLASDNCGFYAHPTAPPLRQMNLPTTTLDAVLAGRTPGPTVVKIDTEGHELAVLAGMADTLKRFPDLSLLIEFNPKMQRAASRRPEELLQELDRLGFAIFLLDDRQGLPFRLTPKADWTRFMSSQDYANLYCVRNDRALSVCFFSHSAGLTGAERSLLELVTDLVHNEGTVCSVVVPADGPLVTALTQAGAACLVSSYAWWCDASSAVLAPDALERLRPDLENLLCNTLPTLARIDPDVIQTQTMVIPWGAVAAALLNKPHVWSVHESGHQLRFFVPFEKILQDIVNSSSLIYTCSDMLGAALFPALEVAKRRTRYPHIRLPDPSRDAKTSGCFARNGAVHLGVFGTLQKSKGQEDAIRALALLVERGRDVELLLAGWPDPDYRAELQVLINAHGLADRIQIPGFLPDPFIAMRETNIVLACSRGEAFGRTVVEGMLLGKPVIYAAAGGFLETMIDGQTGLSYPPGDAAALAARIETVLDDPQQAAAMGATARAWAAERFNRSTVSRDVFPTFQSLRHQPPHLTHIPATLQAMVQQWQQRSWLKRAFHRWRAPGTLRNKAGLLRRWERSFRKRRKQIKILRRWEESLRKF
jgi:FkbM family methyltransferase